MQVTCKKENPSSLADVSKRGLKSSSVCSYDIVRREIRMGFSKYISYDAMVLFEGPILRRFTYLRIKENINTKFVKNIALPAVVLQFYPEIRPVYI